MAQSTFGSIGTRAAAYADMNALARAIPQEVIGLFCEARTIPPNKTDTIKFRRANPLPALTVPLVEGVTPNAQAMSYTDVTVQLQQWGSAIQITDKVDDMAEDPVLRDASSLLGEQWAESAELLRWGVLRGGSNVFFNNGTARNQVNTAVTLNKIRAVVRFLQAQRARPISEVLAASDKIATRPVESAFIALVHTDVSPDIRGLAGFTSVAAYGSMKPICPQELGAVENVRFIATPLLAPFLNAGSGTLNGMVGGSAADVYPIIIFGKEAFGHVVLRGKNNFNIKVLNPGEADKSDPLGQRGYVSGKTYFNAVRLNESWMVRLEVATTAL
jgi:N4-gp56 family major capsid protein